jgi:ankyrin repeat protein
MAHFGAEKATNTLLKKGANNNSKDKYGRTPISYAARSGYEAVVGFPVPSRLSIQGFWALGAAYIED